jgi:hypothetical protein
MSSVRESIRKTSKVSDCNHHGSRLGRLAILVAQVLALGIAGCGGSDDDTTSAQGGPAPVPAPAPAPAPAPSPAPAPAPGSFSVSLSWAAPELNTDGTSLTDVAGYQIAYGTSATNLNRQLNANGGNTTTATVTDLAAGTHFFSIRTLNSSGVASAASAVVSQSVP